jgi:AraC-like DNA-binding protein
MSAPPFSFVVRRPAPPLSDHVDVLWHAQGRIGYARDHILPTGYAVLVVNLGSPIRTTGASGDEVLQRRAWVCGVQTGAMLNEPQAETHALGVAFAPHAAHAVLGVPLVELTDRVVALEDVWGAAGRELRERVGQERTAATRLAAAEAWLRARLLDDGMPRGLHAALRRLCGVPPLSIRTLCREVGVSHKHFIDRCKRFVGLPPQQVIRIQRLNRTLEAIDPQRPIDWAGLAVTHGYCDQPHLVREFGRLAGFTPGEYLARRLAVFGPGLRAGQEPSFVPIARPVNPIQYAGVPAGQDPPR